MERSNISTTPTLSNASPKSASPSFFDGRQFSYTTIPPLSLTYAQATSRPQTTASTLSRYDYFNFLPEEIIQEDSNHYRISNGKKIRAENLHAVEKSNLDNFMLVQRCITPKIDQKHDIKHNSKEEDDMTSFGNFLESRRRRN